MSDRTPAAADTVVVSAYTKALSESTACCLTAALADDPLFIANFGWEGFFTWMNWQLHQSFGLAEVVVDKVSGEVISAALWEEANMTLGAGLRGVCMMGYMTY